MKVLSVNVGLPKEVESNGQKIFTSIYKTPITGPVLAANHHLEGDESGNKKVHGGEYQAVYAYSIEDYKYWQDHEPSLAIQAPLFGENLTVEGVEFEDLCIGDTLKVGNATLMATLPRTPCKALGMVVNNPLFIKKFLATCKMGVYFKIVEEGVIEMGDEIRFVSRDPQSLKVYDLTRFIQKKYSKESIKDHLNHPEMCPRWRKTVESRY